MIYRPVARLIERGILVIALLLYFALALGAVTAKSPTNDEPIHLVRGAAVRQNGDLGLQYEHTPLSHQLIGSLSSSEPTMPVVRDLTTRPTNDRSAIAHEFLWESGLNVNRALFLGRMPIVWAGALLGAALALWTAAATRHHAALAVVLAFFATSPNLLASAALATTDFMATVTFFATVCAWWFFAQKPGRRRWFLTGVLLGLALSAKLTGVLLIPVLVILAYVYPPRKPWWRPGLSALALLPVAGLVLWAVYGLQISPWRGATVPAAAYWDSWAAVLSHVSGGHQAFFLGQVSGSGWWSYFPAALALKTPLPVLLLFGAALVVMLRARAWRIGAFILLPAAVILAAAIYSRLNIGYRHILPAIPFMLLAIGLGVPAIWPRRAGPWVLGAAVSWALVAALWIHPHHLAYFNEMAGGRGYRYLGDSNLDWGQDLKHLATYAARYRAETGQPLFFSYTGVADREYYGLTGPSLIEQFDAGSGEFAPANPPPGRYALNARDWQGIGLRESDLFDWFRRREPLLTLGGSILVYEVAEEMDGTWVAHCTAPGRILESAEAEQLLGRKELRHVDFDCRTNWVFPNDGEPGWYVLPGGGEQWIDDWLGQDGVEVAYRHRANAYGPEYVIAYWPGANNMAAVGDGLTTYSGDEGEPASLRAYGANKAEWVTQWQVTAPTAEPLSIKAHLTTGDEPPLVADGLGFTSNQWQPGDWFIQRHIFSDSGKSLATGLYNYVTLEAVGPPSQLSVP